MSIDEVLIAMSIIGLGMLLGGGVYESVVMAPNHRNNVPESLVHLRQFLKITTPANYFRFVSPTTFLILTVTVVACWHVEAARWWIAGALCIHIISDTITYSYHYPRNKILFVDPLIDDADRLLRLSKEWNRGNIVRIILLSVSVSLTLIGLVALAQQSLT